MFILDIKNIKLQRLQLYLDAEHKILQGQSYSIGDRQLTRADLKYVQSMINQLSAELNSDSVSNRKFFVPFDR